MKTQHLIAALTLATPLAANAGTHVWSGAGANTLWSNASNWSSGGVPSPAEAAPLKLIFPDTAVGFTSSLNIDNLKIDSMEFTVGTGASYTFPNAGISTTFTGAAGDNILITGQLGGVTWQPAINLQATCRINTTTVVNDIDFQGVISGNGGITKTGTGTLEFSTSGAANTFTGVMRVEAGRLDLNKLAGTPCFGGNLETAGIGYVRVLRSNQIPDTAAISFSGGGLSIETDSGVASTSEQIGSFSVSGTASVGARSPNTLILGGIVACENTAAAQLTLKADSGAQITLGGASRTFAVAHANALINVQGLVTDGGSSAGINKTGPGKLRLTNANTLSGAFSVSGGVLEAYNAGSLGSSAGATSVSAGATLSLDAITLPAAETISLSGTIQTSGGASAEIQGNVSFSGSPVLAPSSGNTLKLSGALSGSPAELIIGGGIIEFAGSAPNTYTGVTSFLGNATLALNKSAGNAIGGTINPSNGTLKSLGSNQINDAASIWFATGGTFDLNGKTETVDSIYSSSTAVDPRIKLGDGSLTMIGNADYQLGFDSPSKACIITGSSLAAFRKQGSGKVTLVHTFAGGSIVQDTTLYVHNGILDLQRFWPSPIRVVGGLLKGSATTGNIVAAGGDIAFEKFVSTGINNTGLGGNLIFALNGAIPGMGFPNVTVNGTVDLTGVQLQSSASFLPRTGSDFTLIKNNGPNPVTGIFTGRPEGSIVTIGGKSYQLTYQGGPLGRDVVLHFLDTGTPEPAITALVRELNGFLRIDFTGIPGETVTLWYNTNGLSGTWVSLGNFVMDESGSRSHFINNPGTPREFYRLSYTK